MTDWFSLAELASYLQQDVDTSSATLARATAQTMVLNHTGQLIEAGTTTLARLPVVQADPRAAAFGWSAAIELPQRPATAVTQVVADGVVLVSGTDYEWSGFQIVGISTDEYYADVTYAHGTAVLPSGVKACALMAAGRLYRNPDQLQQQTVSDYSVSFVGTKDYSLTPAEVALLPRWLQ